MQQYRDQKTEYVWQELNSFGSKVKKMLEVFFGLQIYSRFKPIRL